jgi:hypothetical protein
VRLDVEREQSVDPGGAQAAGNRRTGLAETDEADRWWGRQ